VTLLKKKAVVAGHICIDITPVFPDVRAGALGDLLIPGKLIQTEKADIHTGGAVANTGLAMRFFGVETELMGKIGNDEFGSMIVNLLEKHDAAQGLIISEQVSTSYSIVLAVPGIDRIFLHHPGANDTFVYEDIPQEKLADAALFHFGYPSIMKSMFENEGKELVRILKHIKEMGLATSLDMAAVDANSEAGQADWRKILKNVLPYVDFFVPSAEELCFMLDKDRFCSWNQRACGRDVTELLSIEEDIRPLAKQCMAFGAKVVMIKCGAPGIYYQCADKETLKTTGSRLALDAEAWALRSGFEKSYRPERLLSATGAGDVSIAAFLASVLAGRDVEDCVRLAAAAGASCVTSYDALGGLLTLDQLEEKINGGWEKCS